MLKQGASFLKKANIISDAALLVAAFLAAFNMRVEYGGLGQLEDYTWVLLAVVPVWLVLMERYGFYNSQRISNAWLIFKSLVKVTVIGGIVTSSIIFIFDPRGFSRSFFGAFLVLSFAILLAEQFLVRFTLRLARLEGYNYRNVLIVGTGKTATRMLDILDHHKEWGLRVIGLLHIHQQEVASVSGHPVIGSLRDIAEICKSHPVDEVIFCDSKENSLLEFANEITMLGEMGITCRTVLNLYYRFEGKKELGMFHDEVPLLTFRAVSIDADQLFYKRCLDIVGACCGLTFAALFFPFIGLAIKLESPGPLFFGQTRVRENGRTFTCWKFRSMFPDAEARKQELMHLNEMEGAIFKIKNDPRVTRVGAFLRKTSLDEMPQFWNVLRGEMSLVGTRPPTPAEVLGYQNWQRKRICMKPGITGLWQVSGRNSVTDFNEVVRLDLEYIDTWSLATDLRLILRTLKVVFFREGAC
jgi:exopolysaccharide biosynthesis polyprenyl glycosylphosphotransferase